MRKSFLTFIVCFAGLLRAKTISVDVGKLNHRFDPEIIQAEVNDTLQFKFYPTSHGVARAEWHYPCIPYELSGRNKVGFYSGLRPVDVVLSDPPTWDLLINSTEPIFFYCTAEGSCLKEGMIGVINPNASTSLETQRSEALSSSYMVLPGGKLPDEAGTTTSPSSSQTSITTSPSSSQTAVAAATQTHTKLSSGAIAGIAVGGVVAAIFVGALIFILGRQSIMLQFMRRQQFPPPMAYPVGSPVPYQQPNTPMTQNSYVGPYAYPNYSSRENVVELGTDGTSIQPMHDGSQKHGMYPDQFDEYRRQEVTGSPPPPPPPPPGTHLEFPE